MFKKLVSCFIFVAFLSLPLTAFAQTRTAWEQNNGEGLISWGYEALSQDEEFSYANIPSEDDPNWVPYEGPEHINYSYIPSSLCENDYDCLTAAHFTYFRTFVEIPQDITEFKVSAEVVVDGLRITIFNSDYPDGEDIAFISMGGGITEDLKEKVRPGETNTLVITHLDDCCCSGSFLNDVKIIVDEKTVFACTSPEVVTRDTLVVLDNAGNGSISAAEVDAGSTSNCGIASMTVAPDTFTCAHLGDNEVTLTVTDLKGNTETGSAIVTVEDQTSPTVTNYPPNITIDNDPGQCNAVVTWVTPTFTDNCSVVNISSNRSSGDSFPAGCGESTEVIYTAVDSSNNQTTCSFTVTVLDSEAPVVEYCPEDITVNNDPGSCGAYVTWTPPEFNDNCNIASITSTHNPGDFFSLAECADSAQGTVVTYTAIDDCGNVTTCSFTVTVIDNEAPVVVKNCPEDIIVPNDPNVCGAVVTWEPPEFSDNCNIASITSTHNPGDFFSPAECEDSAVGTVVTYTAKDDCGNETTCSFTVTVLDKEAPEISITGVTGSDEGLKLDAVYGYWDSNAVVFWNTEDIVVSYDVLDNCDPDPVVTFMVEWEDEVKEDVGILDPNSKTITIDPYELVGRLKVTVTATDYCGNSASDNTEFSIILFIPEGKMIVKPENFCVNPGKFTNFVWFPELYDVTTITDALSDGAPLVKINFCDGYENGYVDDDCECEYGDIKAILKFNRDEIPEALVDISFILRGMFEYNGKTVYFQGSDEVKWECRQERIQAKGLIKEQRMMTKGQWRETNQNGNGQSENGQNGNGQNGNGKREKTMILPWVDTYSLIFPFNGLQNAILLFNLLW